MDTALAQSLHGLWGKVPMLDAAFALSASFLPYVLVTAFVAMFWGVSGGSEGSAFARRTRRLYAALGVAIAIIVAFGVIIPAIRLGYAPERPFAAFGWKPLIAMSPDAPSFPSGHATLLFLVATAMWQGNRNRGYWLFAGAALVSFARVYAGVHFPIDILCGALLGILSMLLARKALPPLHGSVYHS